MLDVERLERLLLSLQKPLYVYKNNRAMLHSKGPYVSQRTMDARQQLVDSRLVEIHELIMNYSTEVHHGLGVTNAVTTRPYLGRFVRRDGGGSDDGSQRG